MRENIVKKHQSYERFEYLGDAILEFLVSKYLFDTYPEKPELYDVTSLYYLNNLVGTMEASSCSEAKKSLKAFFDI